MKNNEKTLEKNIILPEDLPLSSKQINFCFLHVGGKTRADAYCEAYDRYDMKRNVLHVRAHELAKKPNVEKYINTLREDMRREIMFENTEALKHLIEIASADPNELVEHQRNNCRYCHGVNFQYQWAESEYIKKCDDLKVANTILLSKNVESTLKDEPDILGGFGFDKKREPHPECPVCKGDGESAVLIKDSRKLKGAARRLYKGIKNTKYGPEIRLRDQNEALLAIARHLGMFKDKVEVSGDKNAPVVGINNVVTDPLEAARIYKEYMG